MDNLLKQKITSRLYRLTQVENGELSEDIDALLEDVQQSTEDGCFTLALYDAYERLKHTSSSHYLVNAIHDYGDSAASSYLTDIALNCDVSETDFIYAVEGLLKRKVFDTRIANKILQALEVNLFVKDVSSWDLSDFLRYLEMAYSEDADSKKVLAQIVRAMWLSANNSRSVRAAAFKCYLNVDKMGCLNAVYDKFKDLDEDAQIIAARELVTWKGGLIEKIKSLILTTGFGSARLILQKKAEEDARAAEVQLRTQSDEEVSRFANIGLMSSITNSWTSIRNRAAYLFDKKVLNELSANFAMDATMQKKTKEDLVAAFRDIRSVLEHSVCLDDSELEAINQEIFTVLNIEDNYRKKSMSKLAAFASANGVAVDSSFWGLRPLVALCSTELHDADGDIIKRLRSLKRSGLDNMFIEEKWGELHKAVLTLFYNSLQEMDNALRERAEVKAVAKNG